MSVKHVNEYYQQISQQYVDVLQEIKEFEKDATEGLMEPERLDRIKETLQPLMNNYERWSYMMFLLNMPNRKKKEKGYIKRNRVLLSKIKAQNKAAYSVVENEDVLYKLKQEHSK